MSKMLKRRLHYIPYTTAGWATAELGLGAAASLGWMDFSAVVRGGAVGLCFSTAVALMFGLME